NDTQTPKPENTLLVHKAPTKGTIYFINFGEYDEGGNQTINRGDCTWTVKSVNISARNCDSIWEFQGIDPNTHQPGLSSSISFDKKGDILFQWNEAEEWFNLPVSSRMSFVRENVGTNPLVTDTISFIGVDSILMRG